MVTDLIQLTQLFKNIIPDGTNKTIETNDGFKISLVNKDGEINIKVIKEENNIIDDFKESLEELDDCIFLSSTEEFGEKYDLKKVNDVFNKEHFTDEELSECEDIINEYKKIIHNNIDNKIKELLEIQSKFQSK